MGAKCKSLREIRIYYLHIWTLDVPTISTSMLKEKVDSHPVKCSYILVSVTCLVVFSM